MIYIKNVKEWSNTVELVEVSSLFITIDESKFNFAFASFISRSLGIKCEQEWVHLACINTPVTLRALNNYFFLCWNKTRCNRQCLLSLLFTTPV